MLTFKEFVSDCKLVSFELISEDKSAKTFVVAVRTPIGHWTRRESFSLSLLAEVGDAFARGEMLYQSMKQAYNKYVIDLAQS